MAEKLHSVDEVRDIVESEGLGYAIEHYLSPESIADPALRDHWKQAAESMAAIRDILVDPDADEDE